ncbi:hypothetical protein L0F63_004852 [Massospora cicadina]|nr:hypothetical protein L0F63_004852 [Massospora cicadina]
MLKTLFDHFSQTFPSWLYAVILTNLYRFEVGVYLFKATKLLVRLISGKSELERLCCPYQLDITSIRFVNRDARSTEGNSVEFSIDGDPITVLLVDWAIIHPTKLLMERRMLDSGRAELSLVARNILSKKEFPLNGSTETVEARILRDSLGPIAGSRYLEKEINELAKTKYDPANKRHEQRLVELWNNLKPSEPLEGRITLQWQTIGFQGKDPALDFRGMGILGLEDLLYFSKAYPELSRAILERANHPNSWYSFALVGIHITAYTLELLRTRLLQFQLFQHGVFRTTVQEIYCYLFIQFDRFWFARAVPPTAMDFEGLFVKFRNQTRRRLLQLRPLPFPTL